MSKEKYIFLFAALGIFAVIVVLVSANVQNHASADVSDGRWYCSPDGKLTKNKSVQSHRSFCLKAIEGASQFLPGTPTAYVFEVIDDKGNVVKDFEITHTKIMHVIVVRRDLGQFQHIHPEYDPASGEFTLSNLILPTAGEYR